MLSPRPSAISPTPAPARARSRVAPAPPPRTTRAPAPRCAGLTASARAPWGCPNTSSAAQRRRGPPGCGPERGMVLAREVSKKFEEVARLPLGDASDWLAHPHREQGEFVLVLAAGEARAAESVDAERVLDVLLEALAPSEAAKLAARITGVPKNQLYRRALERAK